MDESALTAQTSLFDLDPDHDINDDDDDSDDDFVDDVEYHDLTEDDQEVPMAGEHLELRSIPLGFDQVPNTAILAPSSCSASCDRCNVPDNDWALVALNATEPQLLNAFFDTNHTSQPTFFWKTQDRLPKEEVSVLVVASNQRVVRGLLQPVPSFLGGVARKMQAEYWTVVLSEGETLHSGDSGSVVIAADSPTVVFGHVVASNPLREVYVSPLEATMNQIMGFLQTRHVSLPEPLPLLSGLAAHHLGKGNDYAFELLNYLDGLLQTTARIPDMFLVDSWSLSSQRAVLLRAVDDSLRATNDPGKIRILHKFSPGHSGTGSGFDLVVFLQTHFTIRRRRDREWGSSYSYVGSDDFDLDTTSSTSLRDYESEHGDSDDQVDDHRRIRSVDKSQSPKESHQTDPLDENVSNAQSPSRSILNKNTMLVKNLLVAAAFGLTSFAAAKQGIDRACGLKIAPCPEDTECIPDSADCTDLDRCTGRCYFKNQYQTCGGHTPKPLPPCKKGTSCIDDSRIPNSCGMACDMTGICAPKKLHTCGGFAGLECPDGLWCYDDPSDDCDPENGGSDCGGICL
ncbi:hypothetical protein CEP53_002197 [Fusarium sp. AF-6]|nr:hypothetical protein CEP53_002197 [Fusarium sp. AF-6]